MSSSFAYSTPISPSRSPLQRKFDSEKKYKERIAQINEKNKECQIRRKWLDDTFKEAMKHEQKRNEHSQKQNEKEQKQNDLEQKQSDPEINQNEQKNTNLLSNSNEVNNIQEYSPNNSNDDS